MLPIQDYLKYNNVALIDPTQEFHQNCIDQYYSKGYLSIKQLDKLRNWCHSTEAIQRLTAGTSTVPSTSQSNLTPFDPEFVPQTKVEEPKTTRARWTQQEEDLFKDLIEYTGSVTLEEVLKEFPDRTPASLRSRAHKFGAFFRKGKFYI